jgi:uncharacterized SAM-binding protein YcdF (DUF218 family)
VIVPSSNLRSARPRRSVWGRVALLVFLAALGWTAWVCANIEWVAHRDDARPADAIAVFGAAEYEGHPSPVLRARLQHTLDLYQRGLAPLIITLGGSDDMEHSEGGVGRIFLTQHGVPETAVVAETLSGTTAESAVQLADIARSRTLKKIIVVSDATHLFRVRQMCRAQGLDVYTSPRSPGRDLGWSEEADRLMHEVASYTLWRMHVT